MYGEKGTTGREILEEDEKKKALRARWKVVNVKRKQGEGIG